MDTTFFFCRYITSDGQEREEFGTLEEESGDERELKIQGFYSYSENGARHKKFYRADKYGSKFGDTAEIYNFMITKPGKHSEKPSAGFPTGAIATLAGGGLG